jgi:hypothetical protein
MCLGVALMCLTICCSLSFRRTNNCRCGAVAFSFFQPTSYATSAPLVIQVAFWGLIRATSFFVAPYSCLASGRLNTGAMLLYGLLFSRPMR